MQRMIIPLACLMILILGCSHPQTPPPSTPHKKIIKLEIEKDQWKNNWKNQLSIERDPSEYEDANNLSFQGAPLARYFHLDVNNINPYKQATNCYGFLESVKDLSTNN